MASYLHIIAFGKLQHGKSIGIDDKRQILFCRIGAVPAHIVSRLKLIGESHAVKLFKQKIFLIFISYLIVGEHIMDDLTCRTYGKIVFEKVF